MQCRPEAAVAESRGQRDQRGDEGQQRQQHHVAHVSRPRRADEDAIHLKGQHAAQRRERGPWQIGIGDGTYLR